MHFARAHALACSIAILTALLWGTDPALPQTDATPSWLSASPHAPGFGLAAVTGVDRGAEPFETSPADGHPDVIVVGATPGGIAAAVSAARAGSRVLLVAESDHLGGMMSSGLGRTDVGNPNAVGGLAREFLDRIHRFYRDTYGDGSAQVADCASGTHFEPRVAEAVFERMTGETARLTVRRGLRLASVEVRGRCISAIQVVDVRTGWPEWLRADQYVDATYEGDLLALAGVSYVVGREGRGDYGEEHAGHLYWDPESRSVAPGGTGEGDGRVQAYNFRVCLTVDPGNRVAIERPADYSRSCYAVLSRAIRQGRVRSLSDVLSLARLPNGKFDANNQPTAWLSSDLAEGSAAYPDAGPEKRERIADAHRRHLLGLLYFLQNDLSVPASLRADARRYGLPRDEFTDTQHFPRQLYVREARRMRGRRVFTENDARPVPGHDRPPIQADSIGVGSYALDSHATSAWDPSRPDLVEGFFYLGSITRPYQIPYGTLLPREFDNLLVSVCVSATHVGYGSLRMEPTYMVMGQAAGVAAHLAATLGVGAGEVPVGRLQDALVLGGQVLTAFSDTRCATANDRAMQVLGTRGVFDGYAAEPEAPATRAVAAQWCASAFAGLAGAPKARKTAEPACPDVAEDHQAAEAVELLAARGAIRAGEPFRGDEPISRDEAERWVSALLGPVSKEPARRVDRSSVSRGEFSVVLYAALREGRRAPPPAREAPQGSPGGTQTASPAPAGPASAVALVVTCLAALGGGASGRVKDWRARDVLIRGLYVITDGSRPGRGHVEIAEAAAEGGASLIQLRDKEASRPEVRRWARRLKDVVPSQVPVLVNDFPEVAAEAGADGAHIGSEDMPVSEARRILGADLLLGVSVHDEEEARRAEAEGADYLGVGAVFPTATKLDIEHRGLAQIGRIRQVSSLPIVAIGGIHAGNIAQVARAGAAAAAVISAVSAAADMVAAVRELVASFEEGDLPP